MKRLFLARATATAAAAAAATLCMMAQICLAQPISPAPANPRTAPNANAQTANAQTANAQTVTPGTLAGAIQSSERTQNADNLLLTYGQAATTPELARAAIGQLLNDYYRLRNQAQTADQATQAVSEAMLRFMVLQTAQNQILVQQNQQVLQQNQRIIELLEAQAKPAARAMAPATRR